MHEHRSLLKPPLAAVVGVNLRFLLAFGTGFLAWACWPASPGWWQAAVISVVLGMLSLAALLQACGLILKVYRRERELAAMLRRGRPPHGADLVRRRALHKARMTDG